MDYEEMLDVFFKPSPQGAPLPAPVSGGRPARRLRDAGEAIAMHWLWPRALYQRYEALGLSFFTSFVGGRGASLGDVPAQLVASSFAVFEPGLIGQLHDEARAACSRDELLAARDEGTIESLNEILKGAEVDGVVAVLRRGLEAADGTGRPLFCGLSALAWPEDPLGQLFRACDMFREHRGGGHVAASIVAGLEPVSMNLLTELWLGFPPGFAYTSTRGWSPEVIEATLDRLRAEGLVEGTSLTESGQRLRDGIEERTDAMQASIIEAIGPDLDPVVVELGAWSQALIDAGGFPPDIYKAAGG